MGPKSDGLYPSPFGCAIFVCADNGNSTGSMNMSKRHQKLIYNILFFSPQSLIDLLSTIVMRTILIISILLVPILAQCYQQTEQLPAEGRNNGQVASKHSYWSYFNVFNPFYWFRSSSANLRKNELPKISNRSDDIGSNNTANNTGDFNQTLKPKLTHDLSTYRNEYGRKLIIKGPVTVTTVRPTTQSMLSESPTSQKEIASTLAAKMPVTKSPVVDLFTTTTARPRIDVSLKPVRKFFIKKKDKVYESTSPYFEGLNTLESRTQLGPTTRASSTTLYDN